MRSETFEDRYRLTEELFSGRFLSTFRALDTVVGTEVEVDILPAAGEDFPLSLERLREILQASLRIRGPHVLPLFAWGEEGGLLYMVRRKAEGKPLTELLSQTGELPAEQVREIVKAAVQVLAEAYGLGLYYLGLNPGQVVLNSQGEPRFVRVGFGWFLEEVEPVEAARVSPYRAPETDEGKEGSRTSDVYSLAVMVSEMLPEDAGTERLRSLLEKAKDPLPRRRPSSPRLLLEELEEGVFPGIKGAPPRVDAEAEEALDDWEDPLMLEGKARFPKPVYPLAGRPRRRPVRKLILMLVGGLVLWLIFAAVSGLLGGDRKGKDQEIPRQEEVNVTLPDLQGMSAEEARNTLHDLGLECSLREAPSRLWSAGRVIAQEPGEGSVLRRGEVVCLVISSGRDDPVEVPKDSEEASPTPPMGARPEAEKAAPLDTGSIPARASASSSDGRVKGKAAPHAVAVLSTRSGPAPLCVRMDAGGSYDPDGDVARYRWRCGDGTILEGITVQHVFDPLVIPARFQVVLEVLDSSGMSDTAVATVEVY